MILKVRAIYTLGSFLLHVIQNVCRFYLSENLSTRKNNLNLFINAIDCILHYLYMVLYPFRYGMSAGNINRILRGLASRLTTQFQRDEVSHRPRNLNCPIPILKEIIRKGI